MNLLKYLIVKLESVEDWTNEYEELKRKTISHFKSDEKIFKIKLMTECCGRLKQREVIWRESEFIRYLELGHFMD